MSVQLRNARIRMAGCITRDILAAGCSCDPTRTEGASYFLADCALSVEVAHTGKFGRAAAALGMPAVTLSRSITAVEHELACQLIHHTSRMFALTDAGKTCYTQ
jgi:hypothetical protein